MNRREVLRGCALGVGALAGASVLVTARGADLPHVSKDDPMAKSLKYTEDAAHSERKSADAFCHTCRLYKGKEGEAYGPCDLFAGKAVNAQGWCSMWTKKG